MTGQQSSDTHGLGQSDASTQGPVEPVAELSAIKHAHAALMRAYVAVLQVASRERHPTVHSEDAARSGRLRSSLVRRHVKRNLRAVASAYRTRQLDRSDEQADAWLKQATTDCDQVVEALPGLRWPGIAVALTVLTAGIGVLREIAKDQELLNLVVGTTFLVILIASLYGRDVVSDSHRWKRNLFFPSADVVDNAAPAVQAEHGSNNIYALENALYTALRRGKKREVQVDWIAANLLLFFWPTFLCWVYLDDPLWKVFGSIAALTVSTLIWAALRHSRERRRIWR